MQNYLYLKEPGTQGGPGYLYSDIAYNVLVQGFGALKFKIC